MSSIVINEKDIIYEKDLNAEVFYYFKVYFIDIYEITKNIVQFN